MKKILVIVACVFMTSYGFAQDLKFGAKAGLNLTNFVGSDIPDNVDMKTGLYFGGFLNTPIGNNLSFQPELLYSRQGVKYSESVLGVTIKTTTKLSYINVPLLLKMSLGASSKFHVYAGPQLGFLVKAEDDIEKEVVASASTTVDVKDNYNKFDLSFNLGLSFDASDNISIDLRYNRGLLKLGDANDSKVYNSGFQLGAAYTF